MTTKTNTAPLVCQAPGCETELDPDYDGPDFCPICEEGEEVGPGASAADVAAIADALDAKAETHRDRAATAMYCGDREGRIAEQARAASYDDAAAMVRGESGS